MKKILFIATIVALIMGTSVDASAKVKRSKRQKAQTSQTIKTSQTIQNPKKMKSHNNTMVVDQGMWTKEGAHRLANGDVANLEQAFLMDFYMEYVFTGNIYNDTYFRYIKLRFTDNGLESIKNEDGSYNWELITGDGEITAENFTIKELDNGRKEFLVQGGNRKCYFEVTGTEGSYKINKVHPEYFMDQAY
jgi:hypothetical protein